MCGYTKTQGYKMCSLHWNKGCINVSSIAEQVQIYQGWTSKSTQIVYEVEKASPLSSSVFVVYNRVRPLLSERSLHTLPVKPIF